MYPDTPSGLIAFLSSNSFIISFLFTIYPDFPHVVSSLLFLWLFKVRFCLNTIWKLVFSTSLISFGSSYTAILYFPSTKLHFLCLIFSLINLQNKFYRILFLPLFLPLHIHSLLVYIFLMFSESVFFSFSSMLYHFCFLHSIKRFLFYFYFYFIKWNIFLDSLFVYYQIEIKFSLYVHSVSLKNFWKDL